MAIDTRQKRSSALGFLAIGVVAILPQGSLDQADRQESVKVYSGILADEPVVTPFAEEQLVTTIRQDQIQLLTLIAGDTLLTPGIRAGQIQMNTPITDDGVLLTTEIQ